METSPGQKDKYKYGERGEEHDSESEPKREQNV
jgi:hypothetical protein